MVSLDLRGWLGSFSANLRRGRSWRIAPFLRVRRWRDWLSTHPMGREARQDGVRRLQSRSPQHPRSETLPVPPQADWQADTPHSQLAPTTPHSIHPPNPISLASPSHASDDQPTDQPTDRHATPPLLHQLPLRPRPLDLVRRHPLVPPLPGMPVQPEGFRLRLRDPRQQARFEDHFAWVGGGFGFDRAGRGCAAQFILRSLSLSLCTERWRWLCGWRGGWAGLRGKRGESVGWGLR